VRPRHSPTCGRLLPPPASRRPFIPSASVGTIRAAGCERLLPVRTRSTWPRSAPIVMAAVEYRAIVDAGFILQVDAPGIAGQPRMARVSANRAASPEFNKRRPRRPFGFEGAESHATAAGHPPRTALRLARVLGPTRRHRTRGTPHLRDVVDLMLAVNAGPRTRSRAGQPAGMQHEWAVCGVRSSSPDGKVPHPWRSSTTRPTLSSIQNSSPSASFASRGASGGTI